MENTLPNGKVISRLGFGCSSLWAKANFSDERADLILQTATEQGLNHFDTGPSYGAGLGEARLGKYLKGKNCDKIVVSTKVGTNVGDHGGIVRDFSPSGMEASFDASLKRLNLERVDILYLHGPPLSEFRDEVYEFFAREKSRGRISYSGINSFDPVVIKTMQSSPIDAIMLQMNVADLSAVTLLDELNEAGKIVTAATILAQGIVRPSSILPTSPARAWYFLRAVKNDPKFYWRGRRIAKILRNFGLTGPSDPLRIVTSEPRVLSGLFGTTNPAHVISNAQAARNLLSPTEHAALLEALSK